MGDEDLERMSLIDDPVARYRTALPDVAPSMSSPGPEAAARAAPGRRLPRLFPCELFLLTAESRGELVPLVTELLAYLDRPHPAPLHDLAFTCSRSYAPARECLAIVASSHEDLRRKLVRAREPLAADRGESIHHRDGIYHFRERLGREKVAFLFPGENAQYTNMLAELCLHFPEIRSAFDEADAACLMADDGFRPSALNFPPPGTTESSGLNEISEWEKAVVLVHTANVALTRLLRALQMRPDAVVGHSFGELAALEMAGVLRAGEGTDRGRFARHAYLHIKELSRERDLPLGRLLAVGGAVRAQIDTLLARFPDSLRVAMENCPRQYVLCTSGPDADTAIAEAEKWLVSEGAICAPLPIRRPYHTPFFEPAFPLEKAYFEEVGVHPPQLEVYSCSTTEPFPSEPRAIVEVAARHWMSCVRFQETIEKMHDRGFRVFVDVGPRGNLCAFVGDILGGKPHLTVALNRPKRSETEQLFNALGMLAAHGVPMSVAHLHERWSSRVVDIRAAEGKGQGRRSLALQLPIHLSTMKAEGVVIGPPAPSEPATACASSAAAAEKATPRGVALAPPAVHSQGSAADVVMISYMETMDRFLSVQGEILGSLMHPGARPAPAEDTPPGRHASPRFPLLGTIQEQIPARSLTARRVFDVREDLYLNDHALGTRLSTTDPALRALPIMPLLFSVEMAAEAGAALFPGRRVIAFVGTRAHRWIFLDKGMVTLRAVARRVEKLGDDVHVHVLIQQEDDGEPTLFPTMAETTVVLAEAYPAPPPSAIPSLPPSAACDWTGTDIYPRRTFHGPLFQGIRSITRLSEEGLDGTVEVLPSSGLIGSQPDAELETDPLLSDCLGQATWLWGSQEPFAGLAYLPFSVGALRFYGRALPPGSRLDLRLRVRRREPLSVVMDIEGIDSLGHVRLVLEGLADREFPITPALHRLIMEPLDHYFAEVEPLELAIPDGGPTRISFSTVADFPPGVLEGSLGVWRKALAFLILSPPERQEWRGRDLSLRREIHWLLGRAAAKDALRHHFQQRAGLRFAAADLVIRNDDTGRPVLDGVWRAELPGRPQISISHTDGMAAAVAATLEEGARLGVDTEKIRTPTQALLDAAFSTAELELLPVADQRSEWVFRCWCSKEAVGKALGSGVSLDPRQLAVTSIDAKSGVVGVRPHGGGEVLVATFRRHEHVVAVTVVRRAGSS